ncbi:MAG TPA: hypothetical protein VG186_14025 [Solirubrobacteraceae bacterium]|nr:hypothetical protein [Solirubrobacteraceae bacterium]
MTVLLEVVGALAVAALVRGLLPGPAPLTAAVSVVAVVVAGFAFWSNAWPDARTLVDEHSRDARLSTEQALAVPGARWGARDDVLAWADAVLPRDANVFLECPQPSNCSNGLANWIAYRLEPRVFTDFPAQAQWILFYATPRSALPSVRLTRVIGYGPGFLIGRVAP